MLFNKNFSEEELLPNRILHMIIDDKFNTARDYTYIICGRSGPTGKTWLWNCLKEHGFNAIEISEDVIGLINYRDDKNHFIVNSANKSVLIILNKPINKM